MVFFNSECARVITSIFPGDQSEMEDIYDIVPGELYLSMLESADFGIFAVDTRGFLLYANDLARNVLDIGRDVSCRDINFSELRKEVWPDYLKVIASGRPTENVTVEYPGFSLLSHRYPIVHKGEVIGIMSVFKLLKEYEELANSLFKTQEYADRIKAIIESSYDGIYVTDGKANTMLVNSAYEKITGLNASELIGRNMEDLVREGYFDESVSLKVISISRPFGNGGMICRT